jgi:predicted dehydrogenase
MITVAILGSGFMGSAHAANYKALGDVCVERSSPRQPNEAARGWPEVVVGAE